MKHRDVLRLVICAMYLGSGIGRSGSYFWQGVLTLLLVGAVGSMVVEAIRDRRKRVHG